MMYHLLRAGRPDLGAEDLLARTVGRGLAVELADALVGCQLGSVFTPVCRVTPRRRAPPCPGRTSPLAIVAVGRLARGAAGAAHGRTRRGGRRRA
jgi:hypothetical protein